jgi:hypothetical protein
MFADGVSNCPKFMRENRYMCCMEASEFEIVIKYLPQSSSTINGMEVICEEFHKLRG